MYLTNSYICTTKKKIYINCVLCYKNKSQIRNVENRTRNSKLFSKLKLDFGSR